MNVALNFFNTLFLFPRFIARKLQYQNRKDTKDLGLHFESQPVSTDKPLTASISRIYELNPGYPDAFAPAPGLS
jgi:hypothetical protein